ncbi:MAG: extracellular solute-binding protein [Treponema sp.]|jgi:arabinogalactan oligomer/maltooligosaccharide transport system substrate-binding protein|nr:extracellular solute-binding protein [Treponema sp.]
MTTKQYALTALVCLALAGPCFAKGAQDAAAADPSGLSGRLTLWIDDAEWGRRLASAFRKAHPGVRITVQQVGSVEAAQKAALDGPAGFGPDVFLMAQDKTAQAITDGICLALPAELQARYESVILEASLKIGASSGALYAVPLSTENIAFFYNKQLLGAEPVPKTFEEVIAFAQKWNKQNRYALQWEVKNGYINYFFLTAFGASLFGPAGNDYILPGWDGEEAAKGLAFHNSLRAYFPIDADSATFENTVGRFQRGEAPFTITGPWAIAEARRNGVDFGVTKLPTIAGKQPRCFSGNIFAAVASASQNQAAAFALLDFMVSVEGEALMYKATGKLPAYKDISGIPELAADPYLAGIQEQSPFADPMPVIPEIAAIWGPLETLFGATWNKAAAIPDAQKAALDAYDTSLLLLGKSRK